jgi:putative addiction module killer protein
VLELRVHWGPGYRVYLARVGNVIVLLLCGGDKRTQQRDIERAKEYFEDYKGRATQAGRRR